MKMPDMSALNIRDTSVININLDDSSNFNLDDLLISHRNKKSNSGNKDRSTVEKNFGTKDTTANISDMFFEISCLIDHVKSPEELGIGNILENLNQILDKVYKLKSKKSLNNRMSPKKMQLSGFKDRLKKLGKLISDQS